MVNKKLKNKYVMIKLEWSTLKKKDFRHLKGIFVIASPAKLN